MPARRFSSRLDLSLGQADMGLDTAEFIPQDASLSASPVISGSAAREAMVLPPIL